jgi:hypothetical protein
LALFTVGGFLFDDGGSLLFYLSFDFDFSFLLPFETASDALDHFYKPNFFAGNI